MAGGVGSRFWPMSTEDRPKQFLDILGTGKSLLQQVVSRFKNICPAENILVVTSYKYKDLVMEQCPELLESNILQEPCMRNTAPCIAYACYKIKETNPMANIVVSPSDLFIADEKKFLDTIRKGLVFARERDVLLTLGMQPNRPETGYGYIQQSEKQIDDFKDIYKVKAFKEKPDIDTAMAYLREGGYSWNSGMFIWSLRSILNAFENYLPEVSQGFIKGIGLYNTDREQEFINNIYPDCTNISIDYGIMEKASNVHVLKSEFGWSDLGTWGSLHERLDRDSSSNAVIGDNVKIIESENCIVHSSGNCRMVIQGLSDCIVAENKGVFMICRKEDEQRIKEFSK